jgi:precorrin-2 dehydrogenase/sirohydrochlorin ferrochelatase
MMGETTTRNISNCQTKTMSDPESKFPKVQGGGSLILAWQIRGKKVLVIGGGEVCSLSLSHTIP